MLDTGYVMNVLYLIEATQVGHDHDWACHSLDDEHDNNTYTVHSQIELKIQALKSKILFHCR